MKKFFAAITKGQHELQIYAETEAQAKEIAETNNYDVTILDQPTTNITYTVLGVSSEDFTNVYSATLDAIAQTQKKLRELDIHKRRLERGVLQLSETFPIIVGEFIIDADKEKTFRSVTRAAQKF